MDQISLTSKKIEEIRKCALYAQALGQAVASLAFYSSDHKTVVECCQELGEIISEYMDAIIIGIDDESKSIKDLLCSNREDRYEDMEKWTSYLKVLGKTISALSFHSDPYPDPRLEGPIQMVLGDIASDYADLIQDSMNEASSVLSDYFRLGDVSFVSELKEQFESIKSSDFGDYGNLEVIERLKQKIDKFKSEDLLQVTRIQIELERIALRIKGDSKNNGCKKNEIGEWEDISLLADRHRVGAC